jgi:flavin-dependent dehydrogenase
MSCIHTLIIGGGQAGLAMSRCLSDLGAEHVVLERGRDAELLAERIVCRAGLQEVAASRAWKEGSWSAASLT